MNKKNAAGVLRDPNGGSVLGAPLPSWAALTPGGGSWAGLTGFSLPVASLVFTRTEMLCRRSGDASPELRALRPCPQSTSK